MDFCEIRSGEKFSIFQQQEREFSHRDMFAHDAITQLNIPRFLQWKPFSLPFCKKKKE